MPLLSWTSYIKGQIRAVWKEPTFIFIPLFCFLLLSPLPPGRVANQRAGWPAHALSDPLFLVDMSSAFGTVKHSERKRMPKVTAYQLDFGSWTPNFFFVDMHSSSASSPVPDRAPEPNSTLVPTPTAAQPAKVAKPFGYGYPTLQPAYQNAAAPPTTAHPSGPAYSGYPQVCIQSCLISRWKLCQLEDVSDNLSLKRWILDKSEYLGFLCICSFYPGVCNQEIKCNLKLDVHKCVCACCVCADDCRAGRERWATWAAAGGSREFPTVHLGRELGSSGKASAHNHWATSTAHNNSFKILYIAKLTVSLENKRM